MIKARRKIVPATLRPMGRHVPVVLAWQMKQQKTAISNKGIDGAF
jgi:hypothetical protein